MSAEATGAEDRRRERATAGFVLPAALLAVALIGLLGGAGWLLAHIEYRVSESHRASTEAFYAADGALEDRLARPGVAGDPTAGTSVSGPPSRESVVSWEPLLLLEGGGALLRARAVARAPSGPRGWSRRTVEALLLLPGPLRPPAALAALSGLEDPAGALLSGLDGAAAGACEGAPAAAVAGVALPAAPGEEGVPAAAEGAPPVLVLPAPEAFRSAALAALGGAADGTDEGVIPVPPGPWPDPDTLPAGRWPVMWTSGETVALGAERAGRGTILVPGDAVLEPGFRWEGLLLVGGALRIEGDVRLLGAAAAGLSRPGGVPPGRATTAGPGIEVRYHSCHVASALAGLRVLPIAIPGTWREAM